MADEFPLPASSYKELIKIIQGYGRIGTEASLTDVAKLTAIGETVVSGNNRFLIAVGVIKAGKKKTITPVGLDLANALEHNMAEEAAVKWRAIVESTDFLQNVVAAVRIRKGMDGSSLESHVAYSAGQPKTPAVATGARTVIDILRAAGLLKEEGGNLVAATPEPPSIPETIQQSLSISETAPTPGRLHVGSYPLGTRLGGVQLTIDVTVQCTPNDLADLGGQLRKLLQDLERPERNPETKTSSTPVTDEEAEG